MKEHVYIKAIPILAAFFVMGFCDIVGISSDYMQKSFGWSATMTGFIPSMVFVWFLFLGIPIGNRMNRYGRKNTVLIGMAVTILGMFLPLALYSSTTCILAYILLGIGNTILQVSLNPLLNNVIASPRLLTSSLTTGQVIKAVSSLVGPEVVLLATTHFGTEKWYYCFPMLGLVTLLFAGWLLFTPIRREQSSEREVSVSESFNLLGNKTILLLFFGIFFIVGVDVSTNYVSSKLMSIRYDWLPEQVKFAPQVYFLSRTIGALLGAFLLTRIAGSRYFKANILACLTAIVLLMCIQSPTVNLLCIGGIGFFASSVFSIIYSMAFQECPTKMNQVSGLMITAVAGGGVVTPIIGIAIDKVGITAGVAVILFCVLYLTFCAFRVKEKSIR